MEKNKTFDIEGWEEVIANLPNAYKKWFKEEAEYLRKNIGENTKVLEVGFGEGRSLMDILPITKNLTGIDHDPKAIEDGKKKFAKYPEIKLLFADAIKLPFKENYFDYVICMTTFANFGKNKIKALEEMKRVVKDNGKIILSVYSEDAFKERMNLYKKINFPIKRIEGTTVFYKGKWSEDTSEQFSDNELKEFFKKAKLKLNELIKLDMSYICKLSK